MTAILGIGNALVDIIIRIQDESILERMALPKGSMTMIDAEQTNALLQETSHIPNEMAQGGAVANTITGLASLGIRTGYIGKIGKDEYGNIFRKNLEEKNIEPHLLFGTSPTGRATTLVTRDGERTFGTYLGAALELNASEIHPSSFRNYDWLVAEGYLVFNRDLIIAAVSMAKQLGMKIAMDMASYNLVDSNRDFLLSLVSQYIDLVFANEMEASALTGFTDPKDALVELGKICPIAVVKIGKDGSWIIRKNEMVKVSGIKADCIDTTGAGDLYAAGFMYGLVNGLDLKKCGEIGSLVGGKTVEVIGARMNNERWEGIKKNIRAIAEN
jgi:sugar/nucleoside kinase (ribokinase family)